MCEWDAEESAGMVCYILLGGGAIVRCWWLVAFAVLVLLLIVRARQKRGAKGPMEELRLAREASAQGFADYSDRMIEAAADFEGRIG